MISGVATAVSSIRSGLLSGTTYHYRVVAAGGKVLQPKMEVPDMLWYAVVRDTEGNELGLAEYM